MADDIDIEAMLEAPYKKVRKYANKGFITIHLALFMKLLLNCKLTSPEPSWFILLDVRYVYLTSNYMLLM